MEFHHQGKIRRKAQCYDYLGELLETGFRDGLIIVLGRTVSDLTI
jgi:hypothetical protein